MNPAAPAFNPNSVGIESTNGAVDTSPKGSEKAAHKSKESTSKWVQKAFKGTAGVRTVGVNTSCQDIPSHDTLVDKELAQNPANQTDENNFPNLKERVQWSGGRLWSEQREVDSDEEEVPDGAPIDEEHVLEDKMCPNVSNKIWAFIDKVFEVTIMYNMVQQLTLRLFHTESHVELVLTLVYAKCDAIERIELWDSLYAMARDMDIPWLIGGDFNVI